jgi:hypothetical protein
MFLAFAFIAAELVIVLKAFSGYSRRQLNHLFDTSKGFLRLTLLLVAIFLPFFLFVIILFSPGMLGRLLANPWFYVVVFIVSMVFSVIAQQDILRVFGCRLSGAIQWFYGWKGMLRLYLLVCAIILPTVWLALFCGGGSGSLIHKRAYANGIFVGNLETLLIIALGLTGYIRRHLAIYDTISRSSAL